MNRKSFTHKVGSELEPNTEDRDLHANPRPFFLHPNPRPATLQPGHVKPGGGVIAQRGSLVRATWRTEGEHHLAVLVAVLRRAKGWAETGTKDTVGGRGGILEGYWYR